MIKSILPPTNPSPPLLKRDNYLLLIKHNWVKLFLKAKQKAASLSDLLVIIMVSIALIYNTWNSEYTGLPLLRLLQNLARKSRMFRKYFSLYIIR